MKPNRKSRTPTPRANSGEKQTKPNTTGGAQARKINKAFMFDCAAREITKNKRSLPALQVLSSPQDLTENQAKTKGSQYVPWSKFGKLKVGAEKTTSGSYVFGTNKKRRGNATASRKITPYVIRDLELKSEERLRNKRKSDNWKRRQELKLKENKEVLDVSKFLRKKVSKEPKKK